MSALHAVLVVEDTRFVAAALEGSIERGFPDLDVFVVSDAENARKALLGQAFLAWDPQRDVYFERRAVIWGAIWDNQFPERHGGDIQEDMGIRTVEALAVSQKVNGAVLARFAVSSSDPASKFKDSKVFRRILSKPITAQELRELFQSWRQI